MCANLCAERNRAVLDSPTSAWIHTELALPLIAAIGFTEAALRGVAGLVFGAFECVYTADARESMYKQTIGGSILSLSVAINSVAMIFLAGNNRVALYPEYGLNTFLPAGQNFLSSFWREPPTRVGAAQVDPVRNTLSYFLLERFFVDGERYLDKSEGKPVNVLIKNVYQLIGGVVGLVVGVAECITKLVLETLQLHWTYPQTVATGMSVYLSGVFLYEMQERSDCNLYAVKNEYLGS